MSVQKPALYKQLKAQILGCVWSSELRMPLIVKISIFKTNTENILRNEIITVVRGYRVISGWPTKTWKLLSFFFFFLPCMWACEESCFYILWLDFASLCDSESWQVSPGGSCSHFCLLVLLPCKRGSRTKSVLSFFADTPHSLVY